MQLIDTGTIIEYDNRKCVVIGKVKDDFGSMFLFMFLSNFVVGNFGKTKIYDMYGNLLSDVKIIGHLNDAEMKDLYFYLVKMKISGRELNTRNDDKSFMDLVDVHFLIIPKEEFNEKEVMNLHPISIRIGSSKRGPIFSLRHDSYKNFDLEYRDCDTVFVWY